MSSRETREEQGLNQESLHPRKKLPDREGITARESLFIVFHEALRVPRQFCRRR